MTRPEGTSGRHNSEIQEILPLSPLQEGLLFHALCDTGEKAVYTVQIVLDLEGAIDEAALRTAAEALLRRHASLRASFIHEGLSHPVQVISREITLPWEVIDLTTLDEWTRTRRLDRLTADDRRRRFDFDTPPLLRFCLVRLNVERYKLLVTFHHILLDGWSIPILVRDLFALYESRGDASTLSRVTPYREYFAWLAKQDRDAGMAAWQEFLAGLEEGTCIAPAKRGTAVEAPEHVLLSLSEEATAALKNYVASNGLTLNTIVQAAWAI